MDLQAFNFKENSEVTSIEGDTLFLKISVETSKNFVSNYSGFSSTAYALKCQPEPLGLTNKIDSIVVYSDKTFEGIEANQSLNNIILLKHDYNTHVYGNERINFSRVKDFLNRPNSSELPFLIALVKASSETLNQKFKAVVYTSGNGIFENETSSLNWK